MEGGSPILASPAPSAGGLQGFLVPLLIKPLNVVVASQQTISWFQFSPQQVQEIPGKVAPPVVDLAHDDVSCTFGKSRENVESKYVVFFTSYVCFVFLAALTELDVGAGLATLVSVENQ